MQTRYRIQICTLLSLACLVPIAVRLLTLQVLRHDDYSSRVESSTERHSLEIVPRGRILDREGRVLAQSLPAWSSFLDLKLLRESGRSDEILRSLSRNLGLDLKDLRGRLGSRGRTVWLKRKMSYEELARLKDLGLYCVGITADERRFYPNGSLARPILGAVNSAGKGIAGLEYSYDREISGRSIRVELTRDGAGHVLLADPELRAEPPPDLQLTIDRAVQFFAEEALSRAVRSRRAKGGTVVVQEPDTGEILAMAEYPGDPMRNGVVQDVFEPGSTFKLVTAAAVLERGVLAPGERIDCEKGKWKLTDEITIKDHDPYGHMGLDGIIEHSSNIGSAKLALRLGTEVFRHYCHQFGFGYKTGVRLPAESSGLLQNEGDWRRVRLANAAFGQGLAVTPLQLIGAFSAVANGGRLLEPRLVRRLGPEPAPGAVVVRRVARPETIRRLQEMLEHVVERGTGISARVPGYQTAGKTGTAQKVDPETGGYSADDYIVSFAGYVPASDPEFTILVVIDSPQVGSYASEVASPVFSSIAARLLALRGVPPDTSLPLSVNGAPRPGLGREKPLPRPPLRPGLGREKPLPRRRPATRAPAGPRPLPRAPLRPGLRHGSPLPRPSMLPGPASSSAPEPDPAAEARPA